MAPFSKEKRKKKTTKKTHLLLYRKSFTLKLLQIGICTAWKDRPIFIQLVYFQSLSADGSYCGCLLRLKGPLCQWKHGRLESAHWGRRSAVIWFTLLLWTHVTHHMSETEFSSCWNRRPKMENFKLFLNRRLVKDLFSGAYWTASSTRRTILNRKEVKKKYPYLRVV